MASAEYTAVVVLLSIVLAIGGATFADDGRQLGSTIATTLERGLCLVSGSACDERGKPRPCVVSSVAKERRAHLDLAVVRLSDGRRVLRERLSDGRIRVTVVQHSGAGGVAGFGARLSLGSLELDADGAAAATVGGGYGRVFEVRGDEAADRLVAGLDAGDWKVGGAAKGLVDFVRSAGGGVERERFYELRGDGDASAALGALGFDAAAAAAASEVGAGLRYDRRTGERALVLRRQAGLDAELDAQIAKVAGGGGLQRSLELVLDRRNRPTALVLRTAGAIGGSVGAGRSGAGGGDRAELEAHLDLTDPELAGPARRLLGGEAGALGGLTRAMWDRARLERRHFRTIAGKSSSGGASLALGARGGIEVDRSSERAELVAASGRDPGMGWTRRLDCEMAAGVPLAA